MLYIETSGKPDAILGHSLSKEGGQTVLYC